MNIYIDHGRATLTERASACSRRLTARCSRIRFEDADANENDEDIPLRHFSKRLMAHRILLLKPSRWRPPFEQRTVLQGEIMHLQNQAAQSLAERCEGIFDVRSTGFEVLALQSTIEFKFPKLCGKHLLADTRQGPAKLGVAPPSLEQLTQDEYLPLAADHGEQAFHFTFNRLELHAQWALKGA
jgi:hypothetical protein